MEDVVVTAVARYMKNVHGYRAEAEATRIQAFCRQLGDRQEVEHWGQVKRALYDMSRSRAVVPPQSTAV
ncbi:hypothetical protein EV659_101110 [Rhodothalassium salexigens DSM 2132]|uniref:Uncharacterized protein n=1 Tax=Rhodothalassium salexigens DSM 2132 TaxID=1188247 RepID=A0A4R2PQW0_RHOSA|nr:hypothetical protein [Rhodothalassium salexigens]MBB4210047.1 hypothetical protein [Rhodothalassium salexigens DSM 2132]MBK1637583.1 hypothetical protein [Rhodothalassium salexigens DSM 2132]TCP38212.1 hypothetical protein EV659_101110 [Rhodothalassium salexigens DSM 2132]